MGTILRNGASPVHHHRHIEIQCRTPSHTYIRMLVSPLAHQAAAMGDSRCGREREREREREKFVDNQIDD